ncbi:MAG TPA: hypothetical protein VNP04_30270 [Alphaproteobacteria bacterium]|nr:hypothetical protein [Alphaproteobacteria bacterium]
MAAERLAKVQWIVEHGYLKSEPLKQSLLSVPREDFIPRRYRDYAYLEVPLPLPGKMASISCPHSYPLLYEPLGLDQGQKFLEVGLGSGFGTAVAREVVGAEGLVVAIEIDPVTFRFARKNLRRAGYTAVARELLQWITDDVALACGVHSLRVQAAIQGTTGTEGSGNEDMATKPSSLSLHRQGILRERIRVAQEMLRECTVCPRLCRVSRFESRTL